MKKVFAKTIFKEMSPISGQIIVRDDGHVRELFVKGTKQTTWSDDQKVFDGTYWKAATSIPFSMQSSNSKFLVIGLGGGTIPKLLLQKYPQANIIALEIDPMIIKIAEDLFSLKNLPQIKLIKADANTWTNRNYKKYLQHFDAIFIDTFFGETFSFDTQMETIKKVREMLTPDGVMVTNRIYNEYEEKVDTYIKDLGDLFQEQMTHIIEGYSGNDNIIIYSKITSNFN